MAVGDVRPRPRPRLQPRRARRAALRLHAPGHRRRPTVVVTTTIENIRVAAGNDILTTPRRDQHRRRRARRHHLGGHRRPRHRRGVRMTATVRLRRRRGRHRAAAAARAAPARQPRHVRRRLGRLQPDPLERAVRARPSASPTSSPTACSRWPRPAASSPTGSATRAPSIEYGVRFTRPVVVPDDDRGATRRDHRGRGREARRRHRARRHHREVPGRHGAGQGAGRRPARLSAVIRSG